MIGEEVDEENLKMGEIATTRSGEGKVSARAKELSVHLREATQRNRTRLDDESRERYERRQVMRRQIRALRNAKREERRAVVRANGGDPEEEVSADEENSEMESEIIPETLTPVSSPEPGGGPQVGEDGIEEEEYQAPPEGVANPDAAEEEEEAEEEEPEEVAYDLTAVQEGAEERHEEEEFDPELAALGFASRPADEEGEYEDEENAETYEDLFAQLEDSRNAALRRNDEREVIEEEQTGRMPNNMSYMKKKSNERWSKEETEFFYQVRPGCVSTEVILIAYRFSGRQARTTPLCPSTFLAGVRSNSRTKGGKRAWRIRIESMRLSELADLSVRDSSIPGSNYNLTSQIPNIYRRQLATIPADPRKQPTSSWKRHASCPQGGQGKIPTAP